MDQALWRIFMISIEGLNILLHATGLSLLISIYKRHENDTQGLYLINLASSELLWNLVAILKDIPILNWYLTGNCSLKRLALSIDIALATGIEYDVILAMCYYTGDRLLQILLHARYEEYWSTRKLMILISVTWMCNVVMSFIFAMLYHYKHKTCEVCLVMARYVSPPLMFIYLVFAVMTYSILFNLYKKSERRNPQKILMTSTNSTQEILRTTTRSTYYIFKNSRFYIALIINSSYLVLSFLPNIIL